jgi:hypothetical protein
MLLGSLLGGMLGERWYTRTSRGALAAEVDVRDRMAAVSAGNGHRARNGNGNGTDDTADADGIDGLTKDELYQRAQERDIPGRSQMSKEELKDALQEQR